jgi:hypothetical protein
LYLCDINNYDYYPIRHLKIKNLAAADVCKKNKGGFIGVEYTVHYCIRTAP